MTCSFPLRTPPRSFTCYFHLYPVGQKWVAWSYLAAREATKCNICAWQPCVHLKFDGYICKRRGNTSILYHYNPSVLDSAMLGRFQKNILLCNCNFYVHGHKQFKLQEGFIFLRRNIIQGKGIVWSKESTVWEIWCFKWYWRFNSKFIRFLNTVTL